MQYTICNMKYAMCNIQYAIYNLQFAVAIHYRTISWQHLFFSTYTLLLTHLVKCISYYQLTNKWMSESKWISESFFSANNWSYFSACS